MWAFCAIHPQDDRRTTIFVLSRTLVQWPEWSMVMVRNPAFIDGPEFATVAATRRQQIFYCLQGGHSARDQAVYQGRGPWWRLSASRIA